MTHPSFPKPTLRDWLLLTIGIVFVIGGLLFLSKDPNGAIPCIAFFGVCTAVFATNIVRKFRSSRLRISGVEVIGGAPLRPSKSYLAIIASALLSLGILLLWYCHSSTILLVVCVVPMILVGALLLLGLLTGHLPIGFLQFDPEGLTIGQRRETFTVPWDAIASVAPGEYHDNAALFLTVSPLGSVIVSPPAASPRVVTQLQSNLKWVGAHVMILSSQYGIELPVLVSAIQRYVGEPAARQRLGTKRLRSG